MGGIVVSNTKEFTGHFYPLKENESPYELMSKLYIEALKTTKNIDRDYTCIDSEGQFAQVVDKAGLNVTNLILCDICTMEG